MCLDAETGSFAENIPVDPLSDFRNVSRIFNITEDQDGFLWMRVNFKLFRFKAAPEGKLDFNSAQQWKYRYTEFMDIYGTLWFNSGNGIHDRYDEQSDGFMHLDHRKMDYFNNDTCIKEEVEGEIWLPSRNGLLRLLPPYSETSEFTISPEKVICYRHQPGDSSSLNSGWIRTIYFSRHYAPGTMWIGTVGGGLAIWDQNNYGNNWKSPAPIIYNNTIVGNKAKDGAGLMLFGGRILVFNNIIWNDLSITGASEINKQDINYGGYVVNEGIIDSYYNNIQGGWTGEGNLGYQPVFQPDSYNLAEHSPGIGYGVASIEVDGNMYYAPLSDFDGDPRPHSIDDLIDVGAFESPYLSTLGKESKRLYSENESVMVYPNPFKIYITLEMQNRKHIHKVEILSLDGRVVRIIDNVNSSSLTINRENLPGGLYFLRIHADEIYTKKVMVD